MLLLLLWFFASTQSVTETQRRAQAPRRHCQGEVKYATRCCYLQSSCMLHPGLQGPRAGEPQPPTPPQPHPQADRPRPGARFIRGVRPQRFCQQVTLGQLGPGPRRAAKLPESARLRARGFRRQDDGYPEPPTQTRPSANPPSCVCPPSALYVMLVREERGGSRSPHHARLARRT